MPTRTAADFALEAPSDGPWTFTTEAGRDLEPRPRSAYTYDEQVAEAELQTEWAQRALVYERGDTPEGDAPESPFLFGLKVRFSKPDVYIEARRKAAESGDPIDVDLSDYDAFWTAEACHWPLESVHALVRELDAHYPLPGSKQEQADAAADPAGDAAGKSEAVGIS